MNKAEVGLLLLFASGLDRFVQVDQVTTDAWFKVISRHEISYPQAEQACIDHYTGPDGSRPFTVAHVINSAAIANRTTSRLVEVDVRTARARGIVGADWPESKPLTVDLAEKLAVARDTDRAVSRMFPQEFGAIDHIDFGLTLKDGAH